GFPRRLPQRFAAGSGAIIMNALCLWAFRVHMLDRGKWATAGAIAAGAIGAVTRVVLQYSFGLHPGSPGVVWTSELLVAWVAAGTSNIVALTHMWNRRRAQEQARLAATNELHVHY